MMTLSKKPYDLLYYFGNFFKDLMQYHIHAKFHSQDLTGLGFMKGVPFNVARYLMSRRPCLVRILL